MRKLTEEELTQCAEKAKRQWWESSRDVSISDMLVEAIMGKLLEVNKMVKCGSLTTHRVTGQKLYYEENRPTAWNSDSECIQLWRIAP
jgi:hypothetical protein